MCLTEKKGRILCVNSISTCFKYPGHSETKVKKPSRPCFCFTEVFGFVHSDLGSISLSTILFWDVPQHSSTLGLLNLIQQSGENRQGQMFKYLTLAAREANGVRGQGPGEEKWEKGHNFQWKKYPSSERAWKQNSEVKDLTCLCCSWKTLKPES